ncbi:MAG: Nif3-like dinuclear metal center hexameric protein [Bacteroidota bacterium]
MSALTVKHIAATLEQEAPLSWQESYDNAGLLVGDPNMELSGVLCTLDITMEVLEEALQKKCNLVVAHHPLIFSPIKKISTANPVERMLMFAIKNNLALYASHTNLDNAYRGVNNLMGKKLGLSQTRILQAAKGQLQKLVVYVPHAHLDEVCNALFAAGAGHIGKYDECSFRTEGTGTFRGGKEANPFIGHVGERHYESETRLEVIVPMHLNKQVMHALRQSHPYEEVAYELIAISNTNRYSGAGLIGNLPRPMSTSELLAHGASVFHCKTIRHTAPVHDTHTLLALCGGSGSFLLPGAKAAGATAFISADFTYHKFFDADNQILILDIGHFESEQFTPEILRELIVEKFPTFAVHLSEIQTNPIHYFIP